MNEELNYYGTFTITDKQKEKLEKIKQLCNLTDREVFSRLLDLVATVTSTKELFLVHRLQNELTHNQFIVTLTDEELEAINNYAESLSLRNSTAIKQLAFKQLELTTKSTTLTEIDGINQHLCLVDRLVHEQKYLEALKVLKDLKQHTNNPNALVAIDKAIKDVSFYESSRNMNNYLNNRD